MTRRALLRLVLALGAAPFSSPSAFSAPPREINSSPSASPREPSPRETLHSVASLPPFISGRFPAARAFERLADGSFYVFDPRAHAVYAVDAAMRKATRIIQIGSESGRVLQPTAFASESSGTFAVADAPNHERIQIFASDGTFLSGFFPSGAPRFEVVLDGLVLGGVGSLQYDGEHLLISEPAGGALISEYSAAGDPIRSFGVLRDTSQADPEVVTLLNTGLPLFDPQGGYAFVFQTGVPLFRRYDRNGQLLFERHIEGPEIDPLVNNLPTTWPSRPAGSHEIPVQHPIVRTAAFDRQGNLWVALVLPDIYVYDPAGEKIRTIELRTPAGVLAATSLFFDARGRLLVTPGCYVFNP
jgi:hypothetical protein